MTIQSLRVRDFMNPAVHTIRPDTEIMNAVHILVDKGISGLLVVDDGGSLVGVLTERDCIEVALQSSYFDELGGNVKDFMTADVSTIDPNTSMLDLAEMFSRLPFRRCPVVDDGKLVGLICRRDVLRALIAGTWFSHPENSIRNS